MGQASQLKLKPCKTAVASNSQPSFSLTASRDIGTYLVVFEGESIAKMYIGNWSDCETMMQEKFGKDLTPHRVKYRTLKR